MADAAADRRLDRVEATLDSLRHNVDAFGPVVRQVLAAELRVEAAGEKITDLAGDLAEVERRLAARLDNCSSSIAELDRKVEGIRGDHAAAQQSRADARTKVVIAVIAGSTTVLAALAGALATVLGG